MGVLCSPEPGASGLYPLCIAHTLMLWLSHFFLQPSCLQWLFACCGQGLVPVSLVSQSEAALGLSRVRPGICQSCSRSCSVLSLCCPLRSFHWWVEPAVRPAVCPQPSAGAAVGLLCVVLFPSPWGRSHFGVVLAPVGAACTLPGSWHHFVWAPAKSIL